MIRVYRQIVVCVAVLVAPFAGDCAEPSVTVDLQVRSDYVFRGLKQSGISATPLVEAGFGDGYAGLLSVLPFDDRDRFGDEHDFYGGYGWAVGDRTALDAGGAYRYRPTGDSAFEAYLGGRQELGTITPSFYIYRDFDADTWTGELSAEVHAPIENLPFTFSAALGRVSADHWSDYTYYGLDALYPVELDGGAKLILGLHYSGNDLGGGVSRNRVYGTAAFTFGF